MTTIIGIDLGTTNSVVASLEHGRPRAIPVDGSPIVPSVVLYQADGGVLVGRQARNLAIQEPERTVVSVKRKMGRATSIDVGGHAVRPEEVSARILRTLKDAAEAELGEPVERAVITVPAYFDDAQRRATLAAGELAGLEVLRLLNEPTAASLVYERPDSSTATTPELMLVYDLGGGTFDVSVLEILGGIREVRSSTGNSALGGDDFDAELVHRFVNEIKTRHGAHVEQDAVALARLRRAAEDAKIALSSAVEVSVREEFLTQAEGAPIHLDLVVTRRELEHMIGGLLRSTIELSQRALADARLAPGERLARICLVGGSTRIPLVRELLAGHFDAEIHEEVDPDLAVALGATVQSGLLQGQPLARVLVDVAAHSLGVRTADAIDEHGLPDAFTPILRRNTALPAERTEELYTAVDAQELVQVEVLQGESPRASENTMVGEFRFPLRPAPVGSPVRVRFAYDLDGVIRVTASQPGGTEKTVALEVPDATLGPHRATRTSDEPPKHVETAIERRARTLLPTLPAHERAALQARLDAYHDASDDETRADAEDALLDLFLEYEGR